MHLKHWNHLKSLKLMYILILYIYIYYYIICIHSSVVSGVPNPLPVVFGSSATCWRCHIFLGFAWDIWRVCYTPSLDSKLGSIELGTLEIFRGIFGEFESRNTCNTKGFQIKEVAYAFVDFNEDLSTSKGGLDPRFYQPNYQITYVHSLWTSTNCLPFRELYGIVWIGKHVHPIIRSFIIQSICRISVVAPACSQPATDLIRRFWSIWVEEG